MRISLDRETVRVTDLVELDEERAEDLIRGLRAVLAPEHAALEIDLGRLSAVDCAVVDALLAIHEEFHAANGGLAWRLLDPAPELRQLLELVRLHRLFEITPSRSALVSQP